MNKQKSCLYRTYVLLGKTDNLQISKYNFSVASDMKKKKAK